MDVAVARRRIIALTAATSSPVLEADEVDDLVANSRRPDADGLVYGDTGWAGVYDIYAAAAEGWRIKAAKAAADFDFSADGASYSKGQVYERCMSMAAQMAAKAGTGVPNSAGGSTLQLVTDYATYDVRNLLA